ncbi:STAS domain-containing protein [Actinosynnema pretiosum]|uniref:STAS domain-containing protein n=1 Tax=Actinosynnema pretiosum TaxID=42197 RepID=A0A290Z7R7_9PSEU|nr:STAS domain-containing protein [Actinosynnema pretiosum]ATE55081.1 hypothetical protein CNX65_18800 [Actinosynnema pretiosum]
MTTMRCHLSHVAGAALMRPVGRLDLSTATPLRQALLRVAADHPVALVVDLTRTEIPAPALLGLLCQVADRVDRWPGIPLALVSPRPVADWIRERLPVSPDLAGALRATAPVPRPRHRRIHLPPTPVSPVRARLFATDTCLAWGLTGLLDAAALVAAALTDNAVAHARTDLWLRLTTADDHTTPDRPAHHHLTRGHLRISVQDRCPTLPNRRRDRSGGLDAVAYAASQWGTAPAVGGKAVWALLDPI